VLRSISGPKRDEVTGDWRKLQNEELHNLYSSSSSIIRIIKPRRMRWAGFIARMGKKGMYRGFWWKRPLGRPRRRRADNIKKDFREEGTG
jgi:hypothetical protein